MSGGGERNGIAGGKKEGEGESTAQKERQVGDKQIGKNGECTFKCGDNAHSSEGLSKIDHHLKKRGRAESRLAPKK